MSLSFLRAVTLTLVEAGLAGITISSPVAGFLPIRFLVAGRLAAFILSKPGSVLKDIRDLPPARQEGGRVEAGTPYMVGELGKELFVPDVSGDIVPNDQLGPSIIAMTSDPDTITKSSGGGGGNSGGGSSSLPANPYAVVTKYAQMTGLFTV